MTWTLLPRVYRATLEPHEADNVERAVEGLARLEQDGLLSRLHMGDILAIIANDILDHSCAKQIASCETSKTSASSGAGGGASS